MGDPRLLCAKVSFSVLSILFFVLFTIYSIYVYCIDEDWWWNTHKKFHMDTDGRYPSISICISDDGPEGFVKLFNIDYRSKNVDENVKENESKITYKEFLQGTCLNGKKNASGMKVCLKLIMIKLLCQLRITSSDFRCFLSMEVNIGLIKPQAQIPRNPFQYFLLY